MTRLATLALSLGLAGMAMAQGYGPPQGGYGPPQGGYGPPPGPPPQYGGRGWDAPPGEFRDVRRQGFLDGVQGAERDFQNHRIWNVKNRDEYRHPPVPGNVRGDYRAGFQRGYYATVQHYQQGGPGPGYGPR